MKGESKNAYVKKFDGKKTSKAYMVPKKQGGDGEESRKLTNIEAWWRAIEIVSQEGEVGEGNFTDKDWGLATKIFKNMMGVASKTEMVDLRCAFLDGIEDLGLFPVGIADDLIEEVRVIRESGRFCRFGL